MSNENNNSESTSNSNNAINPAELVSPTTERAVEDIINNAVQVQQNGTSVNESNHANGESNSTLATTANTTNGSSQNNNDNFENLQKAVQILGRAKQLDDVKRYDEALKMYRQGVDMLLEELMVRQGTEQSRSYLRNKCNDFMNRIDQLKMIIEIEKNGLDNKENQAKQQPAPAN
jgi:hypothetical protein